MMTSPIGMLRRAASSNIRRVASPYSSPRAECFGDVFASHIGVYAQDFAGFGYLHHNRSDLGAVLLGCFVPAIFDGVLVDDLREVVYDLGDMGVCPIVFSLACSYRKLVCGDGPRWSAYRSVMPAINSFCPP